MIPVRLEEREFTVGGLRLNVAVGPQSGPPLVFFHGVTRRGQTFLPLLASFLPRWQIFAVDFPGHGRSGVADGSYLVVDYVRWAEEFLRTQFSGDLYLYGHSLGSMVAAGSLVSPGTVIPPGVLAAGSPAQVKKPLEGTAAEFWVQANPPYYAELAQRHRTGVTPVAGDGFTS